MVPSPDFCRRDFEASSVYSKLLLWIKNISLMTCSYSFLWPEELNTFFPQCLLRHENGFYLLEAYIHFPSGFNHNTLTVWSAQALIESAGVICSLMECCHQVRSLSSECKVWRLTLTRWRKWRTPPAPWRPSVTGDPLGTKTPAKHKRAGERTQLERKQPHCGPAPSKPESRATGQTKKALPHSLCVQGFVGAF